MTSNHIVIEGEECKMQKSILFLSLLFLVCSFPINTFGECVKGDCNNGQGTYVYFGGKKYVGGFKDGKRHGQGTFTISGVRKYVGEWENDLPNGQGTFTFPNGKKYEGEFKDGEYHGQGTFTFSDGSKHVGDWKNGKLNGQGTFTYPDGRTHVGGWKNGKRLAQGTVKETTSKLTESKTVNPSILPEVEYITQYYEECITDTRTRERECSCTWYTEKLFSVLTDLLKQDPTDIKTKQKLKQLIVERDTMAALLYVKSQQYFVSKQTAKEDLGGVVKEAIKCYSLLAKMSPDNKMYVNRKTELAEKWRKEEKQREAIRQKKLQNHMKGPMEMPVSGAIIIIVVLCIVLFLIRNRRRYLLTKQNEERHLREMHQIRTVETEENWIGETDENFIEEEQPTRHISSEVKREIWRRDQGKCVKCGSQRRLEYDHIIPVSKGGSNTARNIQLLCEECNRKKSNNIE